MGLNLTAVDLQSKIEDYARTSDGKKKMSDTISRMSSNGIYRTSAGSRVPSYDSIIEATEIMIQLLKDNSRTYGLPGSVIAHFNSLNYAVGDVTKTGFRTVIIYFNDDLRRESLYISPAQSRKRGGSRTGDGIDNIISLYNNGYNASNKVHGIWDGHEELGSIGSRTHLQANRIITDTIDMFNEWYAFEYGVYATAADIYE